jgi:MoxR-like ATPase
MTEQTTLRTFPARFAGKCHKCHSDIRRGQLITQGYAKIKGIAYHVECYEGGEPPKEEKPHSNGNGTKEAFQAFSEAILPFIEGKIKSKVDQDYVEYLIDGKLKDAIQQNTRRIEIKREDREIKIIENAHQSMGKLLYFISKRHHVYLYGPPGSGKSTASHQVADSLNLDFGYISLNPQTPDSRIVGFIDAGGTYRPTVFRRIYENGGVFCVDELDNASASLLTTLNSGLENGSMAFPDGMIPRHKDFVLVATGNTNGKGANPQFPERRPFDSAFSERFTFLKWDYDTVLEENIVKAINPTEKAEKWLGWVRNVRDYAKKHYPRLIVSPRVSFKGAEYLREDTVSANEIAEGVLFKGMDGDSVKNIYDAVPLPFLGGDQ